MQVGVIRSICLLTFLLSEGKAEELDSLKESKDVDNLKDVAGLIKSGETPDDLKSEINLAVTQPDSRANEERSGDVSQSDARRFEESAVSNAEAHSSGDGSSSAYAESIGGSYQSRATALAEGAPASPFNPFNEELGPYIPPGSSLSQAEALTINSDSYGQGLRAYPYSASYPYSSGQADSGFHQLLPNRNPQPDSELYQQDPVTNPHNLGARPGQAQNQVDNGFYQPGYNGLLNVNAYNQGSGPLGQADSESNQLIIEPYSMLPKPVPRLNSISDSISAFPSSYPYSPGSSSISTHTQENSVPYQAVPLPDSDYSPYESLLVPYKGPISTQTQGNLYKSNSLPDSDISRYDSSMVQYREQNSEKLKVRDESYAFKYQPVSNTNEPKSDTYLSSALTNVGRSREYSPVIDNIDSSADISKSGWDPSEYNNYAPSGPYPQLYPSGAEAAKAYLDFKPATSGISNPYSHGISPYASDYPSESPLRPWDYNLTKIEAKGSSNYFGNANSRAISPHEYVFPNKMPGGENAIQCTNENQFFHFWSQELDCLVCICLNEYGVLQPVCASCGGCHNPPPKLPEKVPLLPESIPVQPATPGPTESVPIMPEPNPEQPIPPYQSVSIPEAYPKVRPPSPVPVTFTEPLATLPPPPNQAHCNPLPTGVPFTNPLHPCQICICRESVVSGKTDVHIECKGNPQCIAPVDVTALPPLPDVPIAMPLPICEKFPEDVLFPHPTETCKLCKCSKNPSGDGAYEQQITCYPHPDCVPKLKPVAESAPPLALPVDLHSVKPSPEPEPEPSEPLREPMELVPLPEVVTVEPLPWPPITTIAPVPAFPMTPRPGPLPGPSPHESCRPYPPNQTFQHPWDECQVCVCSEATAVGMITVEVNCYTKPSCCIDPPDSVKAALPGFNMPYVGLGNTVNSPEVQALSSGSSLVITSTYRPPPAYSSYNPRSVNTYSGSNPASADALNQPAPYSSYPYQPNYAPPYVNPQYPEYPPRLPVRPGTGNTIGQYKPNNFGYPANYQYAQGDVVGNNYAPQGRYQPFDPRYQTVPAPSYPGLYQRPYEMSPMFAPQIRDGYVKPPIAALDIQNLAPNYATSIGYSKSGKDGTEDNSK